MTFNSIAYLWTGMFNDADDQLGSVDPVVVLDIAARWQSVSEQSRELALKLHDISDLDLLAVCKLRYGDSLQETFIHLIEGLTNDAVAINAGWAASYEEVSTLLVRTARLITLKKLNAPKIVIEQTAKLIKNTEHDTYTLCGPAERKNIHKTLAVSLF